MTKFYEAAPTVTELLTHYQEQKVNLLLGPIGGGKTVGIIMALCSIMNTQAPDDRGRRRTRFAVVRNTRPQLKDSVIKSVHDWLPPNGSSVIWKETEMTQVIQYALPDGTVVYSEWAFRSLDNEDDARKLLSVEYTAGWISEFREIPFQLLTDLRSRMGRFPSMADGGATWSGILAESNYPMEGSEWWNLMEVEQPSWLRVYKQPAAVIPDNDRPGQYKINPLAENTRWLVDRYYEDLMEGSTINWQKAMVLCEYPPSLDGKAVYADTWRKELHVAKDIIKPWQFGDFSPTLMIGVDQGRNPAALICQQTPKGTLNVYQELIGTNMGMDRFCDNHLRPALSDRRFVGQPALVVADPAAFQKSQISDVSPADVLKSRGFKVVPAPTNDPGRRIEAVERLLTRIDGMVVDPSCHHLLRGFASDYRFKTKKDGQAEDRPEKKHPISDIHDALQYVALMCGGVNTGRVLNVKAQKAKVPVPSSRAWT